MKIPLSLLMFAAGCALLAQNAPPAYMPPSLPGYLVKTDRELIDAHGVVLVRIDKDGKAHLNASESPEVIVEQLIRLLDGVSRDYGSRLDACKQDEQTIVHEWQQSNERILGDIKGVRKALEGASERKKKDK